MSASSKIPIPPHPFYPPEINLVGYLANDLNVPTLLSYFALGCAAILGTTHLIVGRVNPRLGSADRGLVLWFVLCKCIDGWTRTVRLVGGEPRACGYVKVGVGGRESMAVVQRYKVLTSLSE